MRSIGSLARVLGTLALAVAASSCVIGAPPGFSSGSSWSFPLVGPLEDGLILTPVFVNDKGPYLFVIDPDSPISNIDAGIVSELQLYGGNGGRYLDENDTRHPTKMAEVKTLRVGNLTVRNRTVFASSVGVFAADGRQIRGVLGRDVIADSLVYGFDRDAGMGYLATRKGFTPPAGAIAIGYDTMPPHLESDIQPASRRMVSAQINGHKYDVHVDLGGVPSQLRQEKWNEAGLSAVPAQVQVIDEYGTHRVVQAAGVAGPISVGALQIPAGQQLIAFGDRRWEELSISGVLGLDAFRSFAVYADWDKEKFLLVPRTADTPERIASRIARWGSTELAKCAQPACVDIKLEASGAPADAGAPAPTERRRGAVLHLTRTAESQSLDLEVLIEAVGSDGAPVASLPRLVVELPSGVGELTQGLDPQFDGSTLRVVDASPFVRSCPQGGGGCIFQLPPR